LYPFKKLLFLYLSNPESHYYTMNHDKELKTSSYKANMNKKEGLIGRDILICCLFQSAFQMNSAGLPLVAFDSPYYPSST
jgi:hypothetical protein